MSLPPGVIWAGSHLELFHASVNTSKYSRVGETGRWLPPPGVSGLPHASRSSALLPLEVSGDVPLAWLTSQGAPNGWTSDPLERVQSSRSPIFQQPTTLFFGVWSGL